MALDMSEFFKKYEAIVADADKAFEAVKAQFPEEVRCEKGCCDCCYALFDLTLVEAMYLNHRFNERFSGMQRNQVLERADDADRAIHRLKRKAFKASEEGRSTSEILREMAEARVRCPLLDEDDLCAMYDVRPVTCRLYGVPTAIGGRGHTCGKSGFAPGKPYPTVRLEQLQERLYDLSREIQEAVGSRYTELYAVLVPPSMALMTDYTPDYLGVPRNDDPHKTASGRPMPTAEETAFGPADPDPDTAEAPKGDACASCSEEGSACSSCDLKSITLGGGKDD